MKSKIYLIILVLVGTFIFGCSSKLTLKKEIQSAYNDWNTFSKNKDFENLFAMIHKEFTYTDETGKVETRDKFVERVRYAITNSRNINYKADILELKKDGSKAITNIIYTINLEFKQGEKWTPMNQQLKTSEVFIKENNKWLLLSSKVLAN
jgi:predicted transcriptional regulator